MIRTFIRSQQALSRMLDASIDDKFTTDGNADFQRSCVPKYLAEGLAIVDVGGGKRPFLAPEDRQSLGARVTGLDIDGNELKSAPAGCYDRVVQADVTTFKGEGDADLVICQAVLEHVPNTQAALASIASMLKPSGTATVFVPSRNAIFARINMLLPQRLKLKLLGAIFPHMRRYQGFPAFYDRCTPRDFERLAASCGMTVVETRCYYSSAYFTFFFPLYAMWRLWTLVAARLWGQQAAETFTMVLRKAG